MPPRVTPDQLTVLGLVGSAIVFTGYVLSSHDPGFLWLANFGLFVNWVGDSMDGTLARYRKIERPKYGFFLDHTTDLLTEVMFALGLGLSSFVRFEIACLALIVYLLMAAFIFLRAQVSGLMQITISAHWTDRSARRHGHSQHRHVCGSAKAGAHALGSGLPGRPCGSCRGCRRLCPVSRRDPARGPAVGVDRPDPAKSRCRNRQNVSLKDAWSDRQRTGLGQWPTVGCSGPEPRTLLRLLQARHGTAVRQTARVRRTFRCKNVVFWQKS